MNRHGKAASKALAITVAALLGAGSAQASDMNNLPGAQRDPSKVNSMRRTSQAERVEAANRSAERRKQAELQGLVQPKEKMRLRVPNENVQQRRQQERLQNGPPKQQLDLKRFERSAPRPGGIPTGPGKAGGEGHKHGAGGAGGGSGLHGAATALLNLALAQIGTPDYYAVPNFATSKWPIAHCAGPGSSSAELCQKDSDCSGYIPPYTVGPNIYPSGATCTGAVVPGTGIKKFVDTLAPLCPLGTNNLGNCIPVAEPDLAKFPGSEYYELGLKDYTTRFHSDLGTGTRARGYYQKNASADSPAGQNSYLGPLILARTNVPVRIHFSNDLQSSAAGGNLFIPVDTTLSGTNFGPDGTRYSENRAAIHLHGGNTPWISDGTQHQWTVPSSEPGTTTLRKGLAAAYVPDMWYDAAGAPLDGQGGRADCRQQLTCAAAGATNDPGDGKLTYYYTNQQSGRLMFYHDHAYGITRLNVYAGEAAGYLLVNPDDENRLAAVGTPGTVGTTADLAHMIPLVIQDKTFVPPAYQLSQQDPTWDEAKWSGENGLWMPHVYVPNQWPENPDLSSLNPVGRWNYGPWFWPVQTTLTEVDQAGNGFARPITVPCTTVAAVSDANPNGDTQCPSTPLPSLAPEAFLDTPVINGTAYPVLDVEPRAYRFHVLNAAGERNFNLSFFVADSTGTEVAMVPAAEHTIGAASMPLCAETAPISTVTGTPNGPDLLTPPCWPLEWPTDMRQGGVPDPSFVGPKWVQLGAEGGLLPAAAIIPPRPTVFEMSKLNIVVFNVLSKSLFVGPAERADVVVDFSAYAGQTLILYNDAPAPVPAGDPRQDPFTGGPDFSESGGSPTPLPGYGPNVRTIMQVRVAAAPVAPYEPLPATYDADVSEALATSFRLSQPAPIVPESAYNPVYNPATPYNDTYLTIGAQQLTFTPVGESASMNVQLGSKALHELFTPTYGRMNSLLAVEIPNTNWLNQTTIPFYNFDPPTEYLPNDQIQLWKVTHNGVDTHTIHFHLFNVQIVNRVGWDGAIRPPDANEMGWKEAVRMNPLEDIIVALRPVVQNLPWPLPDMWRPLDVDRPVNAAAGAQFTGMDIYGLPMLVPNALTNFGQEYVWHCHLLGHEEEDMLRAEILIASPEQPTGLTVTPAGGDSVLLAWDDTSKSALGFNVQRDTTPLFTAPVTFNVPRAATQPGPVSYTDTTAVAGPTYYYRVRAEKSLLSTAERPNLQSPGKLYVATSAYSSISQTAAAPVASVDRNTIDFGLQATGTTSSANDVVLTNTGTDTLTLLGLALTGLNPADYGQTNDCGALPATLAAGATCTIHVTFTPLTGGDHPASLTLTSNAPNTAVLEVSLTGSGTGPVASLAPAALTFAAQGQLSTSAAQLVTLTNNGSGNLNITGAALGGAFPGDFGFATTCGATLAAAATCTYGVTFTPTAAGARTASLVVSTDDPVHAILTSTLNGSGIEKATSVTLTPDQPSPHTNGLPVKFTAKGFGPAGIPPSAWQYRFWTNNGTGPVMVRDYAVGTTWSMPSTTIAGTYTVTVDVRTSSGAVVPDATSAPVAYQWDNPKASGVTLTPNVTSPHPVNITPIPVVFTALGQGSSNYLYQFSTSTNGGGNWTVVQPYASTATWTMTTTTLGTYRVRVEVKTNVAAVAADWSTFVDYVLVAPPKATGVTLTSDQPSPQPTGGAYTFRATATGSSGYQYRFYLYNGSTYQMVRNWDSSNVWNWDLTSVAARAYYVGVQVRTTMAGMDVETWQWFTVRTVPVAAADLTMDQSSPHAVGTVPAPVLFTAAGYFDVAKTMPCDATCSYQFSTSSNGGLTWSVQQPYGAATTWTWSAFPAIGSYRVKVDIRASTLVASDTSMTVDYVLVAPPKATGVTLTSDQPSPQPTGGAYTFRATATGSSGYQYRFYLYNGSTYQMVRNWDASNVWNWDLTSVAPRAYYVGVQVRTTTAGTDVETWQWFTVRTVPVAAADLTMDQSSPHAVGTVPAPVLFTAAGYFDAARTMPCDATCSYQFSTSSNGGLTWSVQQPYGAAATWTWSTFPAIGSYRVKVDIRASTLVASDTSMTVDYVLVAPPKATGVTLTADQPSPQPTGGAYTFRATATGSSGYQYRFYLYNGSTYQMVRNWDASNVWNWDLTSVALRAYYVGVQVRTTTAGGFDVETWNWYSVQ